MTKTKSERRPNAELMDEASWTEEGKILEPVKGRRAIVSVPFDQETFTRVSKAAEHSGEKLSVFIRNAALERADRLSTSEIFGILVDPLGQVAAGTSRGTIISIYTASMPIWESGQSDPVTIHTG